MKKFSFKYSPVLKILLGVIAAVFATAVTFNIYDAVRFFGVFTTKFAFALTIALLSLILLILVLSALFCAKYVVGGKYLFFYFGLIRTKTDIREIFQLTLFKEQDKLVIYFKNQKYAVVLIDKKFYDDFYGALKAVNPDILFTVSGAEDDA